MEQTEKTREGDIYDWLAEPMECKTRKGPGGTMLDYIDARQVMDRLDDVVGPDKWQDEYHEVKGNLFCRIGIKIDGEWVWKGDVGKPTAIESIKGEASDAFKRAAVKWGIGRFLYEEEDDTDSDKKTSPSAPQRGTGGSGVTPQMQIAKRAFEEKRDEMFEEVKTCPKCGSKLVERTNKSTGGKFLGCPNYPACSGHSEPLEDKA